MTFFVVFQVERRILEREVGEQTLCADTACQFEQVVVGFAGIEVDAFFHTENLDREDGCFPVTKTCFCYQQHVFHDHSGFCGSIHTIVDGGEGCLCAGTAVHGVQVMEQSFHCLICFFICFFCGFFYSESLCFLIDFHRNADFFCQFGFFCIICFVFVQCRYQTHIFQFGKSFFYDFCVFFTVHDFDERSQIGTIAFFVCLCNAGSHAVIKVGYRLTAVLVVLVRLDSDTCQRSIACNAVRFSQYAMTCGETAFKQF